jgi:hypothetical protein
LLALAAAPAAGQDVLVGMNDVDQPGGPDQLLTIDRGTGAAASLHIFTGTGLNFLESLAWDARENVLWTTNDAVLLRVQPTTFASTTIGTVNFPDVDGLAIQPGTGALYGITYGGNDLLRIDKSDAGAIVINGSLEAGSRLEDLAFDSIGRLFVLTSQALVEVNPATGLRVSKVVLSGATSLEGLVWDSAAGTFLSAADRGEFKDLVTINRSTGQVSFVSSSQHSGFPDIEALAFVPRSSIVPVAMQALPAARDEQGALLAWESMEESLEFVVQRALHAHGPWLEIARVREASSRSAGSKHYEHRDVEAAGSALADRALYYRVGAQDAADVWSWMGFSLAAPPRNVTLRPNSPNPFNPTTVFEVRLSEPAPVDLTLFDVRGHAVRNVRLRLGAGSHQLVWDGRDNGGRALAGGVYPYTLAAGGKTLHGRAVLVK